MVFPLFTLRHVVLPLMTQAYLLPNHKIRSAHMIPRYSRPEMVAIWSPETKFKIWFEIEAHACDAMADLGVIPRENADAVWKAKDVDL